VRQACSLPAVVPGYAGTLKHDGDFLGLAGGWMVHPFHKEVDQFSQYLITHGFHFNNLPGLVHILDGVLVQAVQRGGQFRAVYQGLFQPSLQQVFLVVHETVHGGLNAFADGERAHIMDAGIFFLFCFQFPDITELGFRQERAEQILGGSKIQKSGKIPVLNIRNAVTDIIRSFHQIRQGMAAPAKMCCIRCGTRNQPQMSSHERSSFPFLFPDAEFLAFKLVGRNYAAFLDGGGIRLRTGIFHKGAQNSRRQFQAVALHRISCTCQDAESLGIPFKRQLQAVPFQGGFNGVFTGMAEGRIADVMGQAGGGNNGGDIGRHDRSGQGPFLRQPLPCQHAEGRTDVGYLQAMRQACAHVIVAAQGKNLCFVLKAAESTGKQNTAVIPVIIAAVFLWRCRTPMPGSPARVRQKLLPIHHP